MIQAKNTKELYQAFQNPNSEFRTAPLWVWNDEMTNEAIDFQLKEYKEHGFGGAFVHPRPGLITEYLSEEWFARWNHALETSKKLGLKLYIYDENSYPSGFAGGHVPAALPDCFSTSAEYQMIPAQEAVGEKGSSASWLVSQTLLKAFGMQKRGDKFVIIEDITENDMAEAAGRAISRLEQDKENEDSDGWNYIMLITKQEPQLLSWLGGFANVDLLRPEVTEAFLNCTYEKYYKLFGDEFGKTIPAAFSDEPAITGSTIYNFGKKNNIPFSFWIAEQFERRNGYDLLPHLAALFQDTECGWYRYPAEKVRYDYYTTLRYLWTENFIRPMGKWCHEHGIAWTGHYMENYWPFAVGIATSPCVMANYEHMQWPAIDMLQTDLLKGRPDDPLLITVLEIASVGNQFGKERTLCETYGAGGWDASMEDFKRMADWLLVNGVTFINQHLSYTSITGARKRDHPQSFDWREPWWDEYTLLNDYVARVQVMLSAGYAEQRILVLQPTTAGFLVPPEGETGNLAWKIPVTNPYMENYLAMLQRLTDGQWDFDLGDEFILENNSSIQDGIIAVGKQHYKVVIINEDTVNMKESTRALLQQYLGQGGIVLATGQPGPYIDGIVNAEEYQKLTAMPGWVSCGDLSGLEKMLAEKLDNRVTDNGAFPVGVAHRRRRLENGDIVYFFANSSGKEFEARIHLEEGLLQEWDLFTGARTELSRSEDGSLVLKLKVNEARMFLCIAEESETINNGAAVLGEEICGESDGKEKAEADISVEVNATSIYPEEPNVYPIDYCDLTLNGDAIKGVNVIHAGHLLFKRRGFFANPWDNAIQFKNRIMDRNHYPEGSGFSLTYRFETSADWVSGTAVELVAERGDFFGLTCNNKAVNWSGRSEWLEKNCMRAEIGDYIIPGQNEVTLTAAKFDVRLEPEAIYLRGDFGVEADKNFFLTGQKSLGQGTWVKQGYPFYGGAFCYKYEFNLPDNYKNATVKIPEIATTCCSVRVNQVCVGVAGVNLDDCFDITQYLVPGRNEITLRVCGSLKNLLGPHHDPEKLRNNVWPQNWKNAPKYGRPAAQEHDLIDYGVEGKPEIFIF